MATEKPISKFIEMLHTKESATLMCKAWQEGMEATTIHRLTGETVPDHKTRKDFLSLGMAYAEGLPVQRQEVVSMQWHGLKDIRTRLKEGGWLSDSGEPALTLKNRDSAPPSEELASDQSIG